MTAVTFKSPAAPVVKQGPGTPGTPGTPGNPPTPPATSLGSGGNCTSAQTCEWTKTQRCKNLTYPQACEYTIAYSIDCEYNIRQTTDNRYTCSAESQQAGNTCAVGCVKVTFRLGECKTSGGVCDKTIAGPSCTTYGVSPCNLPSYNLDCLSTFSDQSQCTKAGLCLTGTSGCPPLTQGPGMNCARTSVLLGQPCEETVTHNGVQECGLRTTINGNQSVTMAACPEGETTNPDDGLMSSLSLAGILLASAAARRFGLA